MNRHNAAGFSKIGGHQVLNVLVEIKRRIALGSIANQTFSFIIQCGFGFVNQIVW
jgi:hypothetical protein